MSLMMSKSLEGIISLGDDLNEIKKSGTLVFADGVNKSVVFLGFGYDRGKQTKKIRLGIDKQTFKHIYCGSLPYTFDCFENTITLGEDIKNYTMNQTNNTGGYFAILNLEVGR